MKIGAEADIIVSEDRKYIFKRRIRKNYREETLDRHIRKVRTKKEANLLNACRKNNIPVPGVIIEDKYTLKIDFVEGKKLDEYIKECSQKANKLKNILSKCAFFIAEMHKNDIVHGDLTSSNIIVALENDKEIPYFIDFGFGQITHRTEEKAMDIHNFIKSFEATFPQLREYLSDFKKDYFKNSQERDATMVKNRLEKIEHRGRYLKRKKE